ncbi:MAG TPA: TOBE domain-containing protein [Nitrososphaerales archaeon]|nr:TOBE domain-containing protein [Nitrososphaerales archaeon]
MPRHVRLEPAPHLSMEDKRRIVLDEVDALLLRRVSETNSLTEAAKLMGISYRNAWDRIKRMESGSGKKILESRAGGASGGSSRLTPNGMAMFREFRRVRKYLFNAMDDRVSAGNVGYKLSARNRIEARITGIEKGDITSLVKMVTSNPVSLTSIISKEAVDDLGLQEGDEVEAIVKSTEVMVGKVIPSPLHRKKTTK